MKQFLVITLVVLTSFQVSAQYFQTGQDPASVRWRQIDTKHFRLIYPDYFEPQAQKLAGTLETVYPFGSFSLSHSPAKMPVVLHTQTVQSNGLVAWAPRRAEFYTTPHQAIYPQDWLEQLALHEFRHIVQINKVHSNLPAWGRYLLGEQGTAAVFGAYLPWWFIEGDAVVAETALSNFGRGRFPSFLMEQKALAVEKDPIPYDKAFFGSYRDFVPNHYSLGYFLAGNIRARHGISVWEEVLTRIGQKPLSVFPMRHVLKERTEMTSVGHYSAIFDSLRTDWITADMDYESATYKTVSKPGKFYTNFRHNHWVDDSTLISYKTGFQHISSFVQLDAEGNESKLKLPGEIFRESVNGRENWIIWSERVPDLRWQHSGRSLIRLLNTKTKTQFKIKPEFKAFSPSISPDKNQVAVVEADFSNNFWLSVYRISDGELLHRFQTDDNNYFFSPEWLSNQTIAAVILTKKGKQIVSIDFSTGKMDILTQAELADVKQLKFSGEWLYFISSYPGKNSLFRLNIASGLVEQVYEPRFGVESPAISKDGASVVLSDYTSDGFRLIQIPVTGEKIRPLVEVGKGEYPLAEALTAQENGMPDLSVSMSEKYPSKKYSKGKNLLNFHSWAPVYINNTEYEFAPGVSVMSQDKLGISETVLGYKWDFTDQTGRFIAKYSFKGWYPVFDLQFSTGPRASEYWLIRQNQNSQGEIVSQDTTQERYTWGQTNSSLSIRLPLNLERGPFNRLLQPEIQYGFNHYKAHASAPEQFRGGSFHSLAYRLYFHQLLNRSYLDMYPDFGLVIDGSYRHSPLGSIDAGHVQALQSILYLPGFMKNHGIKLYGGAQQKTTHGAFGFSDVVRYARSWGRISTTGIYTGGADYKLPLIYSDWNFWGFLYVRRIKASLFADYTRLKGNFYQDGEIVGRFTEDISSIGAEITFDVNMLRFYAPADMGFRMSYLPEKRNVYFNMLFSIDFTTF